MGVRVAMPAAAAVIVIGPYESRQRT